MLTWDEKSFQEQAEVVLGCFPSLSEEQIDGIIGEWSQDEYEDTWEGHTRALAQLQRLARWETLSVTQRETENALRRKQCQAYK